jgi:hypothetical protein
MGLNRYKYIAEDAYDQTPKDVLKYISALEYEISKLNKELKLKDNE